MSQKTLALHNLANQWISLRSTPRRTGGWSLFQEVRNLSAPKSQCKHRLSEEVEKGSMREPDQVYCFTAPYSTRLRKYLQYNFLFIFLTLRSFLCCVLQRRVEKRWCPKAPVAWRSSWLLWRSVLSATNWRVNFWFQAVIKLVYCQWESHIYPTDMGVGSIFI